MSEDAAQSHGVDTEAGRTGPPVIDSSGTISEGISGQLDGGDSFGDSSRTGQTSTQQGPEYPSDNTRTHRDWVPKPGRIKKCDFCEERSPAIIHQCSQCPVLICQECAFNGQWKRDKIHYISPGSMNWEYPETKKTYVAGPTSQAIAPGFRDNPPPSDDANKDDILGPRRKVHFASDEGSEDEDGPEAQGRQRQIQPPAPYGSSPHDNANEPPETTEPPTACDRRGDSRDPSPRSSPTEENQARSIPGSSTQPEQSLPHGGPGLRGAILTAAAGRSEVRASAAMAMHRMSTPARRYREDMQNLVETGDASAGRGSNPGPSRRPSTGSRRPGRPQIVQPPRAPARRVASAVPYYPMPQTGPYTGPFSSRMREQQVMSVYYDVFQVEGYRPFALTLAQLPRTIEPDVMAGLAHHDPPLLGAPRRTNFQLRQIQTTAPPEHEVYHRQVQEYMMTGGYFDRARQLPPQPPNYAEDSFRNYPNGHRYGPTMRNTPIWSPLNDLSAEELRIMHNDRFIQATIASAWNGNPIIRRIRAFGLQAWNLTNLVGQDGAGPGDFDALKLLWEVAQVRMGRVVLPSAPQTRRWFVDVLQHTFFEQETSEQSGNDGMGGVAGAENNISPDADGDGEGDAEVGGPLDNVVRGDDVEDDSEEHDDKRDSDYDPSMDE